MWSVLAHRDRWPIVRQIDRMTEKIEKVLIKTEKENSHIHLHCHVEIESA